MLKSFQEMGIAVTKSVIEKIMEFMDTDESGSIDLGYGVRIFDLSIVLAIVVLNFH